MKTSKIIIGISGSSGIIFGIRLLEVLGELGFETHLVVSKAAKLTLSYEVEKTFSELKALAKVYHSNNDLSASIASGSCNTLGMIIAPCSMKTVGEIAHGISGHLLTRAADVVLKERRKLVLMPREAPLHLGHLQNMTQITLMGGIIFPPVPAFYTKPHTIEDLIDDNVGRVLDLFGIENDLARRWKD